MWDHRLKLWVVEVVFADGERRTTVYDYWLEASEQARTYRNLQHEVAMGELTRPKEESIHDPT
jgi:hypothetical protein